MMDIDIDEGMSSRSQIRSHNTRIFAPNPLVSNSSNSGTTSAGQRSPSICEAELFKEHPDWFEAIEIDITRMERFTEADHRRHFSDAYLSSIPKRRRRWLMATPDRVPILQPSLPHAIVNILHRSIMSSNLTNRNLNTLLESLANDTDFQAAYEEFLKTAVNERLKSDDDFCPCRYKYTKEYFDPPTDTD